MNKQIAKNLLASRWAQPGGKSCAHKSPVDLIPETGFLEDST